MGQDTEISLEELAHLRHKEMEPPNARDSADPISPRRITFCNAVVNEANQVAIELAKDGE